VETEQVFIDRTRADTVIVPVAECPVDGKAIKKAVTIKKRIAFFLNSVKGPNMIFPIPQEPGLAKGV
jgi:hypothetical protein